MKDGHVYGFNTSSAIVAFIREAHQVHGDKLKGVIVGKEMLRVLEGAPDYFVMSPFVEHAAVGVVGRVLVYLEGDDYILKPMLD